MINKFYKANIDGKFHGDMTTYLKECKAVENYYKVFSSFYEIESKEFKPCTERLYIKATERDLNRFNGEINRLEDGFNAFRVNGRINRLWMKGCRDKGFQIRVKPNVYDYQVFPRNSGFTRLETFTRDGISYMGTDSAEPFVNPLEFVEISEKEYKEAREGKDERN